MAQEGLDPLISEFRAFCFCTENIEKHEKIHWRKFTKSSGNCRFMSVVVVERVLRVLKSQERVVSGRKFLETQL